MRAYLRFTGHTLLHLDDPSCWIDIKRFAVAAEGTDQDLLAALLSDEQYRDHYAGGSPEQQAPHKPARTVLVVGHQHRVVRAGNR